MQSVPPPPARPAAHTHSTLLASAALLTAVAAHAAWRELQTTDVPKLNAMLTAAHLAPLPIAAVPTAPACTVGGNGDAQEP